jgi:hypothetical protein
MGLHKNEILKVFGNPSSTNSDNYQYDFEIDGKIFHVDFICYDSNNYLCNEISVRWN